MYMVVDGIQHPQQCVSTAGYTKPPHHANKHSAIIILLLHIAASPILLAVRAAYCMHTCHKRIYASLLCEIYLPALPYLLCLPNFFSIFRTAFYLKWNELDMT